MSERQSFPQGVFLSVGTDLFIARNVALEPALSYIRRDVDYPDDSLASDDVAESEIRVALGVAIFIY